MCVNASSIFLSQNQGTLSFSSSLKGSSLGATAVAMNECISVLLMGVGMSLIDWLMCGMGLTLSEEILKPEQSTS